MNISNTGYQISISFSKLLRKVVPLNYFVERFGGDEFIVIAENISGREEAEELIQKIRDMILKFNGLRVKIKRDQKSPCFVCGRGILSIYLTFFFTLLTKRQTHKTANATVTTINTGHTGIGQTPALISLSAW